MQPRHHNQPGPSFVQSGGLPYSLAAPDRHHIRHDGAIGVEWAAPHPGTPMDSNGRYVEAPREFTFRAPYLLHVDSVNRDTEAYPNEASFRFRLPRHAHQVISIEVLNVSYPNADAVPPGRYALLLNGLWDGERFVPQVTYNLGIYETGTSTDTAAGMSEKIARHAMAKLPYNTTAPTDQCWRKSELRQIKYFNPAEPHVQTIELTLADRDGVPLVFDPDVEDHSWNVTLEIVAKG